MKSKGELSPFVLGLIIGIAVKINSRKLQLIREKSYEC